MRNDTEENTVNEINALHDELAAKAQTSLEIAIRVGGLLSDQKKRLSHGTWLPWLQAHIRFSVRTASRYLAVYEGRSRLKSDTVSNLKAAYRLLTDKGGPMTRVEANESLRRIHQHLAALGDALDSAMPFIHQFRRIRDERAYAPEHSTFEGYLLSVGIEPEWFRLEDELLERFAEWSNGGPLQRLLKALKKQDPSIETWALEGELAKS